ncbi:MAG: right-handed parallel beta-helix repeat-containing protein [Phycisphaerae bacterium]
MIPPPHKLVVPTDGMVIRESIRLAPGTHVLPAGLTIAADGVTLDGTDAVLIGADDRGEGIRLHGRRDVTIRGCGIVGYKHGIVASRGERLTLSGNRIRGTAEVPANTVFLDIWRAADDPYGGAILLRDVRDSTIEDNDVQHQMNGLLAYGCRRLTVRRNLANYCSGFGFHLFETSDSVYEENYADYCCRYHPRGERSGHLGADATGFLIVFRSCGNTFRRNFARLGGDGFFLAGMTPKMEKAPCNDNVFEQNDASHSPNNAFEATCSRRNTFRDNRADYCNYGFWLGYSRDNVLENNRIYRNRQAGIAVEHGRGMIVRGNQFLGNGHGVLLWTKRIDAFQEAFPELRVSHDWRIEGNSFREDNKAVRIVSDQDHGVRDLTPPPKTHLRPSDHVIAGNTFQDHRIAVEVIRCDETKIENNTFDATIEADIREADCRGTVRRNNRNAKGEPVARRRAGAVDRVAGRGQPGGTTIQTAADSASQRSDRSRTDELAREFEKAFGGVSRSGIRRRLWWIVLVLVGAGLLIASRAF